MEPFGEWLREQRTARKLTREEFAKRVGCSVAMLRKIEGGERHPSAQISELIANCLDIPLEERSTFVRVARGELGVDRLISESKSIASPNISPPKNNLPIFPTPLIGRKRELEQLSGLLRDPQCRLLTLVGMGGIGKTRLAIETAEQVQDVFANGVNFVPLASVSSIDAIIPTIANVIYFVFYGLGDPKVQLLNYLRDKQMLLIMDNVEHLLDDAPHQGTFVELLVEILRQVPQIKLLITSRETLGMQDEWVFEVQGLPLPKEIQTQKSLQNTSVELFLQRARRAHVEFSATLDDYPAIVRICQLIDGNPLGIELAASWVRTLYCHEIASELEHGLDFLASKVRDLPSRHHSLRAVFDHSWKLLTEEEQGLLLRLSVFRGGFLREAAEHVTDATLPALSALLTKSLIRRNSTGRYDLHELIRQFAAENLANNPDEMRIAQKRHSTYYLNFLEDRGIRLQSHKQKESVIELTADIDNIRAAWDWSIDNHEFVRLYQVSPRLMHLFEVRNSYKEAEITFRKTADSLQASIQESKVDATHQVALHAMLAHWGYFQFRLGKGEEAYHILSPSAAFLRTNARSLGAVYALYYLGIACCILGKFSEANDNLEASRLLARECEERWFEAMDSEFLGRVAIEQGRYDQGRQYLTEALAMLRQLGDPSMIAHALSYLGRGMQLVGEYREAEKLLLESLDLSRENGYHVAMSLALVVLGKIAYVEGRHEEAQPFFSESARLFQEMGDTHRLSRTLYHQGLNSIALGDSAAAQNDFYTALNLANKGGFTPAILNALTGLAVLESQRRGGQEIFELVSYIGQHPASTHETKSLAEQLQMNVEVKLSPEQVETARQNIAFKNLNDFVQMFLTTFDAK